MNPTELRRAVGLHLKALRIQHAEMTMQAACAITKADGPFEITPATLSRIESGQLLPNAEAVVSLSCVYGVTADEILRPMFPPGLEAEGEATE